MFESNFPVDKLAVSYGVLWNGFKRIATECGLTQAEKFAAFCGTAARVYGLALDLTPPAIPMRKGPAPHLHAVRHEHASPAPAFSPTLPPSQTYDAGVPLEARIEELHSELSSTRRRAVVAVVAVAATAWLTATLVLSRRHGAAS